MKNIEFGRPDPDKLLLNIQESSDAGIRGKLKIFFGMCAGVGKTFAMLEDAQRAGKSKTDVVIGIVETHGRKDTEKLTEGLERVPLKEIQYKNSSFFEMDIEAILSRNPALVIVDELAHTNLPGSRHIKRYQDVLELLNRGINVFTTLNIQHLESRAETVKQITGAIIRETLPDSVFDRADEIELIDITPDELLGRLSEGKVYTAERSIAAVTNFFRKGNLTALREMALRLTAERVDKQLRDYKEKQNIPGIWKSSASLLVAIGPSPYSVELIRWTRRLAYSMEASWYAVYVETEQKISDENKELLLKNFELARELGAEVITTSDTDVASGLLRIAHEKNVSQIIIGKARKRSILDRLLKRNILERLLSNSGNIDIHIVGGDLRSAKSDFSSLFSFHSNPGSYVISVLVIILVGIITYPLREEIGYQTISLIFLLVVALMPLFNLGPSSVLLAALLAAVGWDFFFIPPQFTLHIEKPEDVMLLIMFFLVASVTGVLSARSKRNEAFVRQRELRAKALYSLTKQLSEARSLDDVAKIAVSQIKTVFEADVCIIFKNESGALSSQPHPAGNYHPDETGISHATWVYTNRTKAGRFTKTLPSAPATYYPLESRANILGVIAINLQFDTPSGFDQQALLDTFIKQIATVTEREFLNEIAKNAFLYSESEKLYKNLFNSLSHELKTPLTTIISATNSLENPVLLSDKESVKSLAYEISIASQRLNILVENLLDMARLDAGVIKLKYEWHDVRDLAESIQRKLLKEAESHRFNVLVAGAGEIFCFDFALMEQVLINIIRNSIAYTPKGTEIVLSVYSDASACFFEIKDTGPGFPPDSIDKVFNKFFRLQGTRTGGTGLGLSIAQGFIEAHKGTITLRNNPVQGATFTVKIPLIKQVP
ncbi:MAG: sensor protein KdpD [Ignavibacteriales bacterium]